MNATEKLSGTRLAATECPFGLPQATTRDLIRPLLLVGRSEAVQRLRLQVEVAAPHLRGAVLEAEPGFAREHLAHEIYRRSGGPSDGLLCWNAAAAGAIEELELPQTPEGVLVSAVEQARPAAQRRLADIMQRTQMQFGTRWLVLTARPVKSLVAQKQLVPELARVLPEVTVRLTPLRERPEDLPSLASELLAQLNATHVHLTPEALQVLERHSWPGDLDELVRSITLWSQEENPSSLSLSRTLRFPAATSKPGAAWSETQYAVSGPTLLQEVIDIHLLKILQRCNGNKLRAAEMLGISRSTLYRMLDAVTPL